MPRGRKPIFSRAMTPAERQKKRRVKLDDQRRAEIEPLIPTAPVNRVSRYYWTILRIERFLQKGDRRAVTEWLAECLLDRDDLDELLTAVKSEVERRIRLRAVTISRAP